MILYYILRKKLSLGEQGTWDLCVISYNCMLIYKYSKMKSLI